jgi:hypothetical protein
MDNFEISRRMMLRGAAALAALGPPKEALNALVASSTAEAGETAPLDPKPGRKALSLWRALPPVERVRLRRPMSGFLYGLLYGELAPLNSPGVVYSS